MVVDAEEDGFEKLVALEGVGLAIVDVEHVAHLREKAEAGFDRAFGLVYLLKELGAVAGQLCAIGLQGGAAGFEFGGRIGAVLQKFVGALLAERKGAQLGIETGEAGTGVFELGRCVLCRTGASRPEQAPADP